MPDKNNQVVYIGKLTKKAREAGKNGFIVNQYVCDEEYTVERILDLGVVNNVAYFYVKWKGWSSYTNTWESVDNLGNAMHTVKSFLMANTESFGSDYEKFLRMSEEHLNNDLLLERNYSGGKYLLSRMKKQGLFNRLFYLYSNTTPDPDGTYSWKCSLYPDLQLAARIRELYYVWKNKIIQSYPNPENAVQIEIPALPCTFPPEFTFITDYKYSFHLPFQEPVVHCECLDCSKSKNKCCPSFKLIGQSEFAYKYGSLSDKLGYLDRRLKLQPGHIIVECNQNCKCGPDCLNRVVQHGRKVPLELFQTSNARGWGVRALERIYKGMFVMEYVGEVITSAEAEQRGKIYDHLGCTYLFDLNFDGEDNKYSVDAAKFGNESHFINHSCSPNMIVFNVWVDSLNKDLPRIAFFAKRDIKKGEELTFDYEDAGGRSIYEDEEPETCDDIADDATRSNDNVIDEDRPSTSTNLLVQTPPKVEKGEAAIELQASVCILAPLQQITRDVEIAAKMISKVKGSYAGYAQYIEDKKRERLWKWIWQRQRQEEIELQQDEKEKDRLQKELDEKD